MDRLATALANRETGAPAQRLTQLALGLSSSSLFTFLFHILCRAVPLFRELRLLQISRMHGDLCTLLNALAKLPRFNSLALILTACDSGHQVSSPSSGGIITATQEQRQFCQLVEGIRSITGLQELRLVGLQSVYPGSLANALANCIQQAPASFKHLTHLDLSGSLLGCNVTDMYRMLTPLLQLQRLVLQSFNHDTWSFGSSTGAGPVPNALALPHRSWVTYLDVRSNAMANFPLFIWPYLQPNQPALHSMSQEQLPLPGSVCRLKFCSVKVLPDPARSVSCAIRHVPTDGW